MKTTDAMIRGTHHYSFRSGEWAKIIEVKVCTPKDMIERVAFVCEYGDGAIDYIPIVDSPNYEIRGDEPKKICVVDSIIETLRNQGCVFIGGDTVLDHELDPDKECQCGRLNRQVRGA